ncbi:MAG: hypothetical protein GY913_21450 [Proteobacteria bacterium]|nr:hypothetical protein [Actinomycetes bacterium]MCP4919475.1 hypothetical protein [Pseudomonadota bacterium]
MSWRYRERRAEGAGVIVPEDWNEGFSALAGEHNGYHDRDNFPSATLDEEHIVANAMTRGHAVKRGLSPSITAALDTTSWQRALTGGDMPKTTIEVSNDCTVIAEFGVHWEWESTGTNAVQADAVQFRIVIDGVVVSQSGWMSAQFAHDATYLVGALPVGAGYRTIATEMRLANVTWDIDADTVILNALTGTYTDFHVRSAELDIERKIR